MGLDTRTTEVILTRNRNSPGEPTYRPTSLPLATPDTAFAPSDDLSCPFALYEPSSPLAPLNRILYIATDNPSSEAVDVFRRTFPCAFFFADVRDVPPVERLARFVGDRTGEPLERFLIPFVEAEVVAKAQVALGSESLCVCPGATELIGGFRSSSSQPRDRRSRTL